MLAAQAQQTEKNHPNTYSWLGATPHENTLQAIANADILLHPSLIEGGANVIIEAVQHATPVLASRIAGNVGMLGADYLGYFALGDVQACSQGLVRAATDPHFLAQLAKQCALRSPLFSPECEQNAIRRVVHGVLQSN